MAAETSTFADGSRRSSHRNSNGTEHCLNIVLADRTLSSEGPAGTGEPAPAVRADGEESPTAMAENVAATVPAPPSTTPMSTVAAPTPMSKCEIEFWNLMAFRGLPNTKENLCRVALEDWQSSAELMGKRVEKREKEIRSTRNEIYQVMGFYSAFQGLLLTAVAQSNLLQWNNGGYPLALSAFATGIAAIGAVQKNKIISAWKETNKQENPARKAFIHRVERLRIGGICFPFKDEYKDEPKLAIYPKTLFGTIHTFLFTYETLVTATLITFGALCVASMLQILHHPNYLPPPQ
ncbi:hypothetical protein CY35_16G051000 [Sphagnum magellanicum]|nr:hypothetical protein CY35_16G051000 [Sphagnum magellanicum]